MENNDLNKRVLERLEQKIAIEEFRKEENITAKKETAKKSNHLLKVASFLIVTLLVAGNVYTYATYEKNLFSYVLDKIGIIEDNLIDVNQAEKNNNISLTLENYGIDNSTLILGYKLNLNEKLDYFGDTLCEDSKIVDGEKIYQLQANHNSTFYKISDTEYEIFKIYNIDTKNLSNNPIFKTTLSLYKELDSRTY